MLIVWLSVAIVGVALRILFCRRRTWVGFGDGISGGGHRHHEGVDGWHGGGADVDSVGGGDFGSGGGGGGDGFGGGGGDGGFGGGGGGAGDGGFGGGGASAV